MFTPVLFLFLVLISRLNTSDCFVSSTISRGSVFHLPSRSSNSEVQHTLASAQSSKPGSRKNEHELSASTIFRPLEEYLSEQQWRSIFIMLPVFASLMVGTQATIAETLSFDPALFQPVCHFSDLIYQFLKFAVSAIIGSDNVSEYGPIIASLLLRVRLELCVIESYFFEAVVPFINQRGLSWVLPFHETVETFLTGSVFAIATNIILLTSTKIISLLFAAIDIITGMPSRFISGVLNKFRKAEQAPSLAAFVLEAYGNIIGTLRNLIEAVDTFIGRYLFLTTVVYVGFKYAHYKFF